MFIETFNKFRFFQVCLEFYLCLFGGVFISLEIANAACTQYVHKYFAFLSLSSGRGCFLIGVGVLSLALWDPSTDGWTEMLNIAAGCFSIAVGVLYRITGVWARRSLQHAAASIASEEELRRVFAEANVSMSGALEPEDVVALLAALQPPTLLTDNELRAALLVMDTNHDSAISLEELVGWWTDTKATVALAADATAQDSDGEQANHKNKMYHATAGHGLLRVVSTAAGLGLTVAAFIGFWVELTVVSSKGWNQGNFVLKAFVDAMLVFFGLVVVLLEARATCGGVNMTLYISEHVRFLNFVWGRGFFYMFLGTLAMSQSAAEEPGTVLAGASIFGVRLANAVVGIAAHRALGGIGAISVEQAEAAFLRADADGNGYLDSDELVHLLHHLGVQLSRHQLESAFCQIDADGNDEITLHEFLRWTQGDAFEQMGGNKARRQGELDTPLLDP